MTSITRQRNPRGEGSRLREPLIDATVALLSETGDASQVSVRAITKRAGVSPTALYLHFPDRDAIVDAAVDAGFSAFNAAVLEAARSTDDPRGRLLAMGEAYLTFARRQPALYAVIFSARRPASESGSVDRGAALDGLIAAVGAVVDSDARPVAMALWSTLHGYATLSAAPGVKDWEPPPAFVARLLAAYC